MGASLIDDSRLGKGRRDVGDAADDGSLAETLRQLIDAVHAVLQRQNGRIRPDHRCNHVERRGIVVGLDRHDDDIHRANERCVLFCTRTHRKVPECRTANLESALANGRQMLTARDEGDVMSRADELRAIVPANCTGAEDGEDHQSFRVQGSNVHGSGF